MQFTFKVNEIPRIREKQGLKIVEKLPENLNLTALLLKLSDKLAKIWSQIDQEGVENQ